jgi:hypothetical protein
MEMFNTHRRDILNFDNYMDLRKPGFGGPKSAIELRDARGNMNDRDPKLKEFRRTVERDPAFSHPVYDPTYKAMTGDLVYRQEKKKPFTYDDRITGIPVVEIEPVEEGRAYSSFTRFINEEVEDELEDELDAELEDELEDNPYAELENDYEESDSDDWNEDEYRQEATAFNNTMSDLRSIEAMLRGFENGENFDDEEEDFGTNPLEDEESPFGEIPDWVKELQAPEDSEGY